MIKWVKDMNTEEEMFYITNNQKNILFKMGNLNRPQFREL